MHSLLSLMALLADGGGDFRDTVEMLVQRYVASAQLEEEG